MTSPSVTAAGLLALQPLKRAATKQAATLPFPDINNSINRSICGSEHGAGWVQERRKARKEGWREDAGYMNDP